MLLLCLKMINQSYLNRKRRVTIIDVILIHYLIFTFNKVGIKIEYASRILFVSLSEISSEKEKLKNCHVNLLFQSLYSDRAK